MDSLRGQPNPESRVRAEHIDRSILFFRSKPGLALHLKRLKRLCLIRQGIVIYAVGSSKRETKE